MSVAAVVSHSLSRLAPEMELLKCLECPVCKRILLAPIYNCEAGHAICSTCILQINHCQICRSKFSRARNFPLESIVNMSLFKCAFVKDGCRERIRGEDFQKHLEICDFRYAICELCECETLDCSKLIPIRNYVNHLVENHKAEKWSINNQNFQLQSHVTSFDDCVWPVRCIRMKQSGDTFLKYERIIGGVYNIWITYVGSERRAKKFKVAVAICSTKNRETAIKWNMAIHSFRESENYLEKHAHVSVPLDVLKTVTTESSRDTIEWMVDYNILTN